MVAPALGADLRADTSDIHPPQMRAELVVMQGSAAAGLVIPYKRILDLALDRWAVWLPSVFTADQAWLSTRSCGGRRLCGGRSGFFGEGGEPVE